MSIKKTQLGVLFLSILVAIFVYRSYFFIGKVPFPSNLLASFYAPWDSQVFPGWEHGIPNKPLGHDALRFFFPIKQTVTDSISSRSIPLWNPYVFAGSPLIANMQSSVFYPSTLLYLLLSPIDAWSIGVVITPIISTVFMYFYLRSIGVRKDISTIVGLLWAYSGFFAVWNQENPAVAQSAIWLPCILYAIEKFSATGKTNYFFLSIVGTSLSFFGGHLQFALYTFIFSTLYLFMRIKVNSKKYVYCIAYLVLSVLLSSLQLIPAFEAFMYSSRSFENSRYVFDTYLVPITHLVNILAPDWEGNPATYNYFGDGSYYDQVLYVGVIPVVFALLGILLFRKSFLVKMYSIAAAVTIIFGFKNNISIFFFSQNIPFFSSVIPSRIFYLTSFYLLVLAAISLNEILQGKLKPNKRHLTLVIAILLTILAGGWAYFLLHKSTGILAMKQEYFMAMERNLLLPSLVFGISVPLFYGAFHIRRFTRVFISVLCVIALFYQYYSYSKNMYFSERAFVYPEHKLFTQLQNNNDHFGRVVGFGKAVVKANIPSYFDIYSLEGVDPMLPKRYATLAWDAYALQSGKPTNHIIEVRFGDLFPEGSTITGEEPIFSFFNISGVRYIVTHDDDKYTVEGNKLSKRSVVPPYTIWEFESLPRAFVTTDYHVDAGIPDLQKHSVTLEKDPRINDKCPTKPAHFIHYNPNILSLKTDSVCEAVLYLSDTFYPGWKADIDGIPVELFVANQAFRAVQVPSGEHIVTMRYDPLSIKIGYYMFLAAVTIIGGWVIFLNVKKV